MRRLALAGFVTVLAWVWPSSAAAQLVVATGQGCPSEVHVIEGSLARSFQPYDPSFLGGVSVTMGDVNGDGTPDIITGAGPGAASHVAVFSGADLGVLASFFAYDPAFAGGVRVAVGDVNGDGFADIITGPGSGGAPHVAVFSGADLSVLASFFAYDPSFRGGVHVAAGDVNGDGRADIITGAGAGGAPHVAVFSGADLSVLSSFFAYDTSFHGGVSVAAGDVDGDGHSDIVTGAASLGASHVAVWSGATGGVLSSFFAFDPVFEGGVRVASGDVNEDGRADLIMGSGPGAAPLVRIISGLTGNDLGIFPLNSSCGVFVGSVGDASGLRFTSDATTTFSAGSTGTFTVTTAGNPAPAITSSGALPTGVTFVDSGDGTAVLSGTPAAGTGGAYALTFTADNGGPAPATQSFTLTVTEAPAITSTAATTFPLGAPGTFTVTTTGFPVSTITQGGATLPAGVSFTDNGNGTGTLSGTPAPGTGGTYALTFTAGNGIGAPAVQTFTLTVNGAPAFTSANTTTFTVGSAGTFTVTTVASPTAAISVSGALPAGVTFVDNGDGTGTLAGTPPAGTGGAHALTFAATNGILPDGSQAFTLTVNEAPAITSATTTTFTVGTGTSFTVTTTGFPAPTITQGGVALPAGLTFVDLGNGTGTLTGVAASGTGGTYAITFTATNVAGTPAPQAFTLVVNQAPAITSAAATTFAVGSAGTFIVTTIGFPLPALSATGALPTGITFVDNLNGTGTLSGTPTVGAGGVYALTLTAANGVLPNGTQAFTLTVNEGPIITSAPSATFTIGTAGSFTVTTSGLPLPTLAIGGVLPAGVTFADNGNGTGTLSGTPAAGTGGSHAITFTATNTIGSSAPQAFTLTVSGPPSITSANTTTFTAGTPGTFTVTAIGSPSPALTVSGTLPAGVTFIDNGGGSGTLSGMPAAGTGGTYALTFTAANGVLPDATQAFTLIVNEGPAITSAAATTFTVGSAGSFNVVMTGFPAPTVSVTAGTLPAGVTLTPAGLLSGTPGTGTGGTYNVTLTAANGIGADAVQAFTLTINEPPIITSVNTATFVLNTAGTTFQVVMTGIPAPTVSVTSGVLPTGLTLSAAGLLAGTPTQSGSFPVTLTATNGTLPNATQAFTVVVNGAPAITSAAATTFTVGSAGSFTVVMTGFPAPTVSVTAGTLPAGVTLSPAGLLSGTPDPGTGGVHNVTFTATNGIGANAVQAFTLTVNQAPAITSANTAAFVVNTAGTTFQVVMTGFPAPTVSVTAGTLPTGLTLSSAGLLSGTPTQSGSFPVTLTATNGTLPNAVQAFTLSVNQPPAITSAASTTFTVGTPGTFTVTTTGFPTPTVSQTGTLPTGVTFTPATRVLGGTATQTGAFPLVFTATNAIPPDATQNFTLNVVCPTITVTPLTLANGLYQTAYAAVDFNQTGSTGSTFTWSATGLIAGLSIDISTGIVSGTPTNTVLNSAVAITVTDNFGCTGVVNTTLTVRPTADNENYTGGVGNTQYVVGVTPVPTTPHVLNLDSTNVNVKMGDDGPGPLTVTFPATSTNAGVIVEGGTDGTFTYTPAAGFTGTTDTFTYTLTDGNNVTNTATVTINLAGMVWYVNSAGGNGDGRSHNPFNTLASATTPSLANHVVYVHSGGATTPGNLTLDVGQLLRGQGGSAFTLSGLTIPAGTAPTLTGTVTLGNATQVVATNFAPSGIPALVANGTTAVTIDTVNVTGGTNALSLTNVTGVVNVANSIFTNATGAEVLISGGTANVNIGAAISSNAGRSVDIQSRSGGIVTFTGAITDTGQGIFLNANTGSTINFTGGLALTTTTNPGFTATGGGTVSATQNNTTIVNTITTTTGTALNVANTTIGASGLTFRSISAGTAAGSAGNGIVLNNTGTSGANGGLTITGTGSAGTGGTIQHKTGANGSTTDGIGIYLNQTRNASFSWMQLNHFDNFAVRGNELNGLTLSNVVVNGTSGNDAGSDEGAVLLEDSGGTIAITNSNISGGFEDNLRVDYNNAVAGPAASFNVTGSTFRDLQAAGQNAQVNLRSQTSASSGWVAAFNFTSNTFENDANTLPPGGTENWSDGILVTFEGPFAHDLTVQNSTFHHLFQGMDIASNFSADVDYVILNNNITFTEGVAAIAIGNGSSSTSSSLLTALIQGNTIGTSGVAQSGSRLGQGIVVDVRGEETAQFTIHGNTIRRNEVGGIDVLANTGDGDLHIQITNNVIEQVEDDVGGGISDGMRVLTATGSLHDICLDARNNDSFKIGAGAGDELQLRQSNSGVVFAIEGLTGSGTSAANVESFLDGQNPLFNPADGGTRVRTVASVVNFTTAASCTTPPTQ